MKEISQKTVENNGMEYNHEENEWIITKRIFMNIPSDAVVIFHSTCDDIVSFEIDNVRLTLYGNAAPQITIVGHRYSR